jgi:hypothetical protein
VRFVGLDHAREPAAFAGIVKLTGDEEACRALNIALAPGMVAQEIAFAPGRERLTGNVFFRFVFAKGGCEYPKCFAKPARVNVRQGCCAIGLDGGSHQAIGMLTLFVDTPLKEPPALAELL